MSGEPNEAYPERWLERLPVLRARPMLAALAMLAIVGGALMLRFAVHDALPPGFPYVTFFPAVIVCSFLFGVRIGSGAAVLCGLCAWYFFITPGHFGVTLGSGVALGFYVFVVGTDLVIIHWLQRAIRRLARERETSAALAATRELLFRELQHRVSNNLQVAAGLLALQKRTVADADAHAALDEAARRLALIGRISRQLYDTDGAARGMAGFLEPICADVTEASGRRDIRCVVTAPSDITVAPDAAVPLALIVAEAIANAIEHGFGDRAGGLIEVELRRDPVGMTIVEVRDNGRGLPEGFDMRGGHSLGLSIATTLAAQLDGRFELVPGIGGTARLTLPARMAS